MEIVSWRGWEPADDHLWIGVEDSVRGAWMPAFTTTSRIDNPAVVTATTIGDRVIACQFGNTGQTSRSVEQIWSLGLQRLNPLDTSEGELVVTFDGGSTLWSCMARITLPGAVVDGAVTVFDVVWHTTDPLWHAATVTTEAGALIPATITNPTFATNTTGWTKSADPTNVTSAFSRDAAVYYDAAGSGKLTVTANTGAGGFVYVLNDTEHPIAPGDLVTIKCAVRTTNNYDPFGEAGLGAWPVIRFYDSSDSVISTASDYPLSQNANEWAEMVNNSHLVPQYAPALTDYFKIGVQIQIDASQTGTVYFDDFQFVTGPVGSATPFEVEGNAPTNLKLTITPDGDFPQAIYARTFSIANTGTRSVVNHPYRVDLGNGSSNLTNGTYWALLREGKPQPAEITDYDAVQGYLWMVIGSLQPGETANYTLLVSDQTVLPGVDYAFDRYTAPAFDIGDAYVTTTTGSSATVTNIPTGLGSEIDRWIGGYMTVLSGAQAGTTIEITDSTTTSVTHAALGGGALASGVSVAIFMSSNSRWVYPVRKTERSDAQRGLWYLSSGQKKPNDYSEDVPGSWHLDLYYDNNDVFNQKWNTAFNPGGTDDYVAILDANRRWEGSPDLLDSGGYDGVAIFLPVEITAARFDFQWKNPNSMAAFVATSRQENGAATWLHEFTDATASTTLANEAIQNVTLEADSYGFGLFVIPNGGDEIGEGWAGDDGTATSATATTLTDSSKEWIADQFIGGTIKIVSGVGAGQNVAITDNTDTVITVASWPGGTPDGTSRYVIVNKDYVATARNHTYLHLALDQSALVTSAVSAETPAFVLYRDLLINTVDGLSAETEMQRISINPETTGRYIVLLADESFVVDGETMQGWIADSDTGATIRTAPPQAFSVLDVGDDYRAALHWLRVNPGDHSVTLAADETGVAVTIDVAFTTAMYS